MKKKYCIIRKDLQDSVLLIPVGDTYIEFIDADQRIEYRWINEDTKEEQFQVFVDGEWLDAESMDFDFID